MAKTKKSLFQLPGASPQEMEGVRMIVALQAVAGKVETDKAALRGWRAMSAAEKEQTLLAYRTLCLPQ